MKRNDSQQPVIVGFPDSSLVSPEFRNEILDGCENKYDDTKHIILKKFPSHIISEERRTYLKNEATMIYHHMTLESYDPEQNDFFQSEQFSEDNDNNNWLDLPLDKQVFTKFEFATSVGCEHYIRGCQKKCDRCNKYYPCRLCHDAQEDHEFPRYDTKMVKCNYCQFEQQFSNECINCGKQFCINWCQTCKIICGMGNNAKPMFHCNGCGCCNVGLEKGNKHCDKCVSCFKAKYFDQHTCISDEQDCIVCLTPLKKSIYGRITLDCKHQMHEHCYSQLIDSGITQCPMCKKFLLQGSQRERAIKYLSDLYQIQIISYQNVGRRVLVYCNECCTQFETQYTELYYCKTCKLFNIDEIKQVKSLSYQDAIEQHIKERQNDPDQLYPKYPILEDIIKVLEKTFPQYSLQEIESQIGLQINEKNLQLIMTTLNQYPKSLEEFKQFINNVQNFQEEFEENEEEELEEISEQDGEV